MVLERCHFGRKHASFQKGAIVQCMVKTQPGQYIKNQASSAGGAFSGRGVSMFEGISILKPSAAVETIMPGIWLCQWSSFKSFWPCNNNNVKYCLVLEELQVQLYNKLKQQTWWTNRSCGGKSLGAFTCSLILALNSASSSSSRSNDRSHTLIMTCNGQVQCKMSFGWEIGETRRVLR